MRNFNAQGIFALPLLFSTHTHTPSQSFSYQVFLFFLILLMRIALVLAASVYTEMNAISRGVSLGIYEKSKQEGIEASRTGSQPYVDLMGRRSVFSLPLDASRLF